MRTAFSLPAGRTAKSYVASGAGLGRGLGTAGYGGLTRKDPPEIETAAGRATAGRIVPIAIPKMYVFGDTDLQQPSFRSNRSFFQIKQSGVWRARLVPLLKTCTKPGTRTKKMIGSVHCWIENRNQIPCLGKSLPAGTKNHSEYISVITFVAAALSAFSIIVASALSSMVETCKNTKQS
uniref:Uncharacterized protein n=1 Tax=Brassica oleracea var. oleracea TaxID=109376 RepID=A0A0D3AUR3_BRAOL